MIDKFGTAKVNTKLGSMHLFLGDNASRLECLFMEKHLYAYCPQEKDLNGEKGGFGMKKEEMVAFLNLLDKKELIEVLLNFVESGKSSL
jgi:hypothetical protein